MTDETTTETATTTPAPTTEAVVENPTPITMPIPAAVSTALPVSSVATIAADSETLKKDTENEGHGILHTLHDDFAEWIEAAERTPREILTWIEGKL